MSLISRRMEDYLEAIYLLETKDKCARTSDIAKALRVKKPSAHKAIQRLVDRGCLKHDKYSTVSLTNKGKRLAKEVYKRHKVIKSFFIKVLNIDECAAESNACRIEHVLDNEIISKFAQVTKMKLDDSRSCELL